MTHWLHLANKTEPSMCSGSAALCQITLTTCCILRSHLAIRTKIVYKCQHCMAAQYLQAYCEPMSTCSSRCLQSISSSLLAVPRTRTNYGDRSFAVYGPRVWNSLPDELRSPDITLATFRNKLKTLLFNV